MTEKHRRGGIPERDQKMLWGAAGAHCSFPQCPRDLIVDATTETNPVLVGEMAHIVASSPDGPRGDSPLSREERDCFDNLVLLCPEHHKTIDENIGLYTTQLLHRYKREHESRRHNLYRDPRMEAAAAPSAPTLTETVFSTLMAVLQLPQFVYEAEHVVADRPTLKQEFVEVHGHSAPPFILRGQRLWTFENLKPEDNIFARWVLPGTSRRFSAGALWDDPDDERGYMALLNAVLRKLAGRLRLELPLDAKNEWHFPPNTDGSPRSVDYQPLNQQRSQRSVAWQPTLRATGEKRKYWEHLAVGMHFIRVDSSSWVLALRPGRRFTRDGTQKLTPKGTGRRSTSRKSRLYNRDVLEEANFWRSYLSEGKPRIVFKVGGNQAVIIESALLPTTVNWPGVPGDIGRYDNAQPPADDLFSFADLEEIEAAEDDEALIGDEDENDD
ncbi:hypothetical protein FJV41_22305 [Myxococcus llanfairpwllgwyngyllgogerychwyrndrobwllllantysiliogogogochensis]|uniref:HNH nuclease domain-containing protein n=1 Tax=Myxococcus llanfairpwllgwyngyllgogerychwyrndrobwllllantysiliogogogochensis TaxID=2590453 RepID=A0A540WXI3_9BACT|nr:hypothetical protein [Myxococcus llanfairpwllgwyngyllgogerychwyrndrobwllllantysiliogogogochensis]TQF13716.1 hypothetical protein FJV41_22305 [Myxococcus llanfairpwllgwyngyllgogerychwyrndrobwllllantysiliogogogochensis]